MKNSKTLRLTLEEFGYDLDKLMFPINGLESAICEAMDRAKLEHAEKIAKKLKSITPIYTDSEKAQQIILKLKP